MQERWQRHMSVESRAKELQLVQSISQQRKDLVSGVLVSDCILYRYMYCKLNQLYLGCSCRNVCTGMALQYRNNRAERRSVDGGILLRE